MNIFTDPQTWASLFTLTALEIVLGVDNLVFLAIVSSRLPPAQQQLGRKIGLILACVMRILLLATASWIVNMKEPFFTVFNQAISGRDILLIGGGLFLLVKGTNEIHAMFEERGMEILVGVADKMRLSFPVAITQIVLLDIIFSFDSVITAVGMSQQFIIMATAIVIAIVAMLFISDPLSAFIEKHPSIKMLALSFLILVGVILIADGFAFHVPRGYVYFAIAFSIFVETLNILAGSRRVSKPE